MVANSAWARFKWSQANRKRVEKEKQEKQEHNRQRAAEQSELNQKVALLRSASAGRVAASRDHLLEDNRRWRQEEAKREQFALAEKARRLEVLQAEHRKMLAAKYQPANGTHFANEFMRCSGSLTGNSMPSEELAAALLETKRKGTGSKRPSTAGPAAGAAVVSNSAVARLRWAQANRKRVEDERRLEQAHNRQRAAEQSELNQKVALLRSASAGRVAASRDHLLEDNRRWRQEEAKREQFALAEKARRLEVLQAEHRMMREASFHAVTAEYEMSDIGRLSRRNSSITLAPGGQVRKAKR